MVTVIKEEQDMIKFLKKAFRDMKESTKEQHKVTKANFAAAKAESKITWEEAKLTPSERQKLMQAKRETEIAVANERKAAAEKKVEEIKSYKNK